MDEYEAYDHKHSAKHEPEDERGNSKAVEGPKNDKKKSDANNAAPAQEGTITKPFLRKRVLDGTKAFERITACATVAIAIMTYFYTSYSRGQLRAMQNQLTAMQAANTVSAGSAYAACVSAQIAREALLDAQRSSDDAHGASVAAAYQARTATESERAIISPILGTTPIIGEDISVRFFIKNLGKTAGKNMSLKIRAVFSPRERDPDFAYPPNQTTSARANVLDAGQQGPELNNNPFGSVTVKNNNGSAYAATSEDKTAYASGKSDIIVFGQITFWDVFGVRHSTTFCKPYQVFQAGPLASTGHKKCGAYNKEDNNSSIAVPKGIPAFTQLKVPEITCQPPESLFPEKR